MFNKLVFSSITIENDKLFGGVNYTQIVESEDNLSVGTVGCASISFTSEIINLTYINQTCQYYVKQNCDSAYRLVGTFTVLGVTKNKNRYTVTAYDNVCKFDKNVWSTVNSITYPITLGDLFSTICTACGCTAQSTTFTNSTFSIEQNWFEKTITGRQVLNYIAEAAGGFIKCRTDGKIEVYHYAVDTSISQLSTPSPTGSSSGTVSWSEITNASGYEIVASQDGVIAGQGYTNSTGTWVDEPSSEGIGKDKYTSYDYQDYYTPTVDYVHIGKSSTDVGVYAGTPYDNAIDIVNNPLLTITTTNQTNVQTVCTNIYNVIHSITYQPAECSLFADYGIETGEIVKVGGRPFYVMEKSWTASGVTISCKGTSTRDSGELPTQAEKEASGSVSDVTEVTDDLYDITDDLQDQIDDLDIPTTYVKSSSVSGNVLTLTDQDDIQTTFTGGPSTYIKNAEIISTSTLRLTKQDDTYIDFAGGGGVPIFG